MNVAEYTEKQIKFESLWREFDVLIGSLNEINLTVGEKQYLVEELSYKLLKDDAESILYRVLKRTIINNTL